MGQAIQTITAADKGISAITTMIEQAKGIAQSAQSASATYDNVTLAGVSGGTADKVTLTVSAGMTVGATVSVGGVLLTAISGSTVSVTQFQVTGTAQTDANNIQAAIVAAGLTVYSATTGATTVVFSKIDTTYGDAANVTTAMVVVASTTGISEALTAGTAGDAITLNLATGTEVMHATFSKLIAADAGSSSNYWYSGGNYENTSNTTDATTLAAKITANTDLSGAGYTATAKDGVITLARSKYDLTAAMVTATTSYGVALSSTETSELASLVTQYNTLRTQLDELAEDAGYKGKNLLSADTLTVKFEGATLDVVGFDSSTTGLAIGSSTWTTGGNIDTDITALDTALSKLRNESSKMAGNLSIITVRNDFSTNMINTLTQGADKLTLADANEEGANMLMLQTRQSLGTTALSMSSQAAQSILRLF